MMGLMGHNQSFESSTSLADSHFLHCLQPALLRLLRHVALAPCYAVGICSDMAVVRLVIFDAYSEREESPLAEFRATLSSRSGGDGVGVAMAGGRGTGGYKGGGFNTLPPPAVYKAHIKIDLKMGEIVWISFFNWTRFTASHFK